MKIVDKQIQTLTRRAKVPIAFDYHGKHQIAGIEDFWLESGEWWEGRPERAVYRVRTTKGGMFELYRNKGQAPWFLYKVYD